MARYEHVLSPIQIGSKRFRNRVSFAPVWPTLATADGHVNTALMEWVRALAKGGAACVNVGTCAINADLPKEVAHLLRIGEESLTNELSELADVAHMYGSRLGVEIYPISPVNESFETRDSHGKVAVEVDPTDLTHEDIKSCIAEYAAAADRAARAGADVLVIHGAHGQLPACFFSKAINFRTDEYGTQSIENRARFANELLAGIRASVGDRIAIEYRLSASDMIPNSPTIDELIEFVKVIEDKIDLLHISRGMHSMQKLTPYIFQPLYFEHGINIEDASKFKAAVSVPVSAVGSITLDMAEEAIASGKLDMVSIARGLLAEPELINKAKCGDTDRIRPCIRCNNCINITHYFLAPIRCSVNAKQGMELIYKCVDAPERVKKVCVIGGGPGGMEAARTAAERGHQVTLYEKSCCLGGTLKIASAPAFKADLKNYMDWSIRETMRDPNIEVRLGVEATPELIKACRYDAVLVAVGSSPVIPGFVSSAPNAAWVGDVETGAVRTGESVVVVGAGLTGCEAAVNLAMGGKKVKLIDMVPVESFGTGGSKMNRFAIFELLEKYGVELEGGLTLLEVKPDSVVAQREGGEAVSIPCDTAVISMGVRPNTELAESFRGCAQDVVLIGDCDTRQGTIFNAVHTASGAAVTL